MTFRPQPKYASKDAKRGPWSTCDRCGFIWSQHDLRWQYDYLGTAIPINRRLLHCPRCMDSFDDQRKLIILPPDPPPIYNTRPEQYAVDETSWLGDNKGDILTTEGGIPLLTSNPDPNNDIAYTAHLIATLQGNGQSLDLMFMDLFDGNPLVQGRSIMQAITGVATRPNIGSQMTLLIGPSTDNAQNLNAPIVVTPSSKAVTNINFIAFYDAATAGNILMVAPIKYKGPMGAIGLGMNVQFDILDLLILNTALGNFMETEGSALLVTEGGVQIISEH